MYNPHTITKELESALCEYTGARYAVAVNSCTMAITLALRYWLTVETWIADQCVDMEKKPEVWIPKRTYVSVPQAIIHAGGKPIFQDMDWHGSYQLRPYPIHDCARLFTSGMYKQNQFQCLSFHSSKILGDSQGGAVLHDNQEADKWFRRARFDGRAEGSAPIDDKGIILGYHCYLSPDVAARLLWKLQSLPLHNEPLPNDDYPDLSKLDVFK